MRFLLVLFLVCSTATALTAQSKKSDKKATTKETAKKGSAKESSTKTSVAKTTEKKGSAAETSKATTPAVTPKASQTPAGASLVPSKNGQKVYEDSVAFKAAFKELFPHIRPQTTIREKMVQGFANNSRRLQLSTADSSRLLDSLLATTDMNRDEQIMYGVYRSIFTAEELKSISSFVKTPAGKHFLEVEQRLVQARGSEIDRYTNGLISKALAPYRVAQQNARAQARANARAGTPASINVQPVTPSSDSTQTR